jgi:hypothetical protein
MQNSEVRIQNRYKLYLNSGSCLLTSLLFRDIRALSFFEGIARAAELDEGMRVAKASPPIAGNVHKLLLGDKMPAVATLELFFGDLVVARFSKALELRIHRISSKAVRNKSCSGAGVLSTQYIRNRPGILWITKRDKFLSLTMSCIYKRF